jgi:predicted dehydrogenase
LTVTKVPIKLVAMADVFEQKLERAYEALKKAHPETVDVPPERRFIGFDGYQKAMDCLKPGDIVIFTTPLAFRWVHFTYAIQKGLHVFMEKPLTADGPTSRRMLKLAEEADAKNLKVGVGLMSRHSRPMQELQKRIQDGEIGDVILLRGYRMAGPLAECFTEKWPGKPTELLWQISRFHSFIWASGGLFNDFYIHHIDHLCWMKGAWPVKAQAIGGRHYRQLSDGTPLVDQNFDSYAVEYTFPDGAKMYMDGRCVTGCSDFYYSHAHGSKGMAVVADQGDCNPPSSTHRGQKPMRDNVIWTSKNYPGEMDPYLNEWNDLVDAIINDKPYSEVKRGVQASLVTSLGRLAAHTGREMTYDELLKSEFEYAPGVDKLTMDSPSPLLAGPDGKYPVPQPGVITNRDY